MEEKNDFLKVDESSNKKNKQTMLIAVLAAAIIVLAIVLTGILVKALVSMAKTEETTRYETTTNNQTVSTTDEQYLNEFLGIDNNSDVNIDDTVVEGDGSEISSKENDITDTTKNQFIESYEQLSVNGENLLSDNADNEFIQLVANKYGVDTDLLVAIYSVPDSGTNFVLQFNGDKKRGEFIKSPDTLEKVYQIDLEKNIKVATGTASGNEGVSYAESVMCVAMVKKLVMTQYPQYFTGLD